MKARRDFQRLGAALVLGLGSLACAPGCGGSGKAAPEPPVPLLSASPAAQLELQRLLQRFASASPEERVALEPDVVAFRRAHPGDPLLRVVDAHLAWIALEKGDLPHAESLATQLTAGPPGTTRDLAQVVRGAALRRRGRPAEAYAALRPLVGKLIDSYARGLLNQEVVTAATESGAFRAAIDFADVWLRDVADDERPAARARIAELLRRIPAGELARALRERQAAQSEDIPPSELLLRTLLAERLSEVALAQRDVKLAQELLATSGPLLGAQGDPIAQLAAGATIARIGDPTVGLLLSVRTPETRRRAVEAAAGVTFGLGLLRSDAAGPSGGPAVRVVSRDDGVGDDDRAGDALSALAAEGAAAIVAGFDRGQATAAAAFARAQEIPVILLHPPDPRDWGPFVFVLGEEPSRIADALVRALVARGARSVALVGDAETVNSAARPVGVTVALSCDGLLDDRTLRLAGVQGLALNGSADCAGRAITAAEKLPLKIAVGLEALSAAPPGALVAAAGRVPFASEGVGPIGSIGANPVGAVGSIGANPAGAIGSIDANLTGATGSIGPIGSIGAMDPDLAAWRQGQPEPPGWWAALGRDAAVIAKAALTRLPARGTEDPAEVKARRRTVANGIAQAAAPLWTTEATGFGGARKMGREIRVEERPAR